MEHFSDNREFDLYRDINTRTNGEIYIGVVGPVRTGKSTFIKRFMDLMVLPFMEDEHARERTIDELPQSAAGKTIMTTEPKFIPQEAAEIILPELPGSSAGMPQPALSQSVLPGTAIQGSAAQPKIKVRLIDCVGFMVEGASGHMEGNESRMVKTPWSEQEIPFTTAASIGTQKVIRDHATIGIVVTTDGTIGELPRNAYVKAEEQTVEELNAIAKPYVILLNSQKPYSDETMELAAELKEKYQTAVLPVNCEQLRKDDIVRILDSMHKTGDVRALSFTPEQYVSQIKIDETDLATGRVVVRMDLDDKYYYENISELTGVPIAGEYELISMIKEMAGQKEAYEKVSDAFEAVQVKGYGVVSPGLSDIKMEEPVLIRHGNKFGVKMKAVSPSIHMIRANIETEIAPIVGSEEQANDLISYIKQGQQSEEGAWETNIFGKSVGELMEDGIRNKIAMMDDECQMKLQDTMQKIVNDNTGGMVCIII